MPNVRVRFMARLTLARLTCFFVTCLPSNYSCCIYDPSYKVSRNAVGQHSLNRQLKCCYWANSYWTSRLGEFLDIVLSRFQKREGGPAYSNPASAVLAKVRCDARTIGRKD